MGNTRIPSLFTDYVVETDTDGIWTYHKWSSGLYDAWYEGTINMLAGSAMGGGYFHTASSGLTPPSFSTSVTSLTGACNGQTLFAYLGHNVNNQTYWWNGAADALNGIAVRLDMHGRWK